jgi:hypothetical protein
MAELSWLYWLTYNGIAPASRVSTPTLFVHSDEAVLPDNVRSVYGLLKGPKRLAWRTSGGQVDWYDLLTDEAMSEIGPWFQETLADGLTSQRRIT